MVRRDGQPIPSRTSPRTRSFGAFAQGVLGSVAIFALLLFGAIVDSRPAAAQAACGDRANILKTLEQLHSETPQAIGLSTDGALLEILVSSAGSWTILVTYPNRQTCLFAAGENWERVPVVASGSRV